MKSTIQRALLTAVFAAALAGGAGAQAFPDYLSVRAEFLSSVITAKPALALAFAGAYRDSPAGRIRVSVESSGASFFVLFLRERGGAYPYGSRGSMAIARDSATGYMTGVKWFLSDDGQSWVYLAPRNEKTIVDYVVAGSVVKSGYAVSGPIYYFITKPLSYLQSMTPALDWTLVSGTATPAGAAMAEALGRSPITGAARELMEAARDLSRLDSYLAAAGSAGVLPAEETAAPWPRVALPGDERAQGSYGTLPAWTAERGLPLAALPALALRGMAAERCFIAFVDSGDGGPARTLVVVPYRTAGGDGALLAMDAEAGKPVDLAALVRSRPRAFAKVYGLPLPH